MGCELCVMNKMNHENEVIIACNQALKVLHLENLSFRPMRRKNRLNKQRGFVIGRTSLRTGLITIDILTAKLGKPKKISSILAVLCHEAAHHQKKPYRQIYRGRAIVRQHYPKFYKQVTKNLKKLKKDKILKHYFS